MSRTSTTLTMSLRPVTAGGDDVLHLAFYGARQGEVYGSLWTRELPVPSDPTMSPQERLRAAAVAILLHTGGLPEVPEI